MNVELTPAAEEHKSVLSNLIQLYCYDISEIRGYDMTAHGTFVYPYLDHYFVEDTREACFMTADGALAGFTMTRRLDDGAREVSEFFVVRRHRRHGIGQTAAHQMFRRHPGPWELAFDHANPPAARFWPHVTAAIADGPIHRTERYPPDVKYPRTRLRLHVPEAPGNNALATRTPARLLRVTTPNGGDARVVEMVGRSRRGPARRWMRWLPR